MQDALADADLADVMQLGAERDRVDQIGIERKRARDFDRIIRDPHGVAAGVGVFCLECVDQRVHALEKQLLDAPCLRLDPNLEVLLIAAVFDQETSFVERLGDTRPDFVEMKRFGDVIERAHLKTGDGAFDFGDRGHHDNRRLGPARDHLAQECNAVHLRHPQIGDDERHRLALELGDRLDTRACLRAGKTVALEQPDQHAPQPRLIVDDETAHSGEVGHRR